MPFRIPILAAIACLAQAGAQGFAGDLIAATFKFHHPSSTSTCLVMTRGEDDPARYLVTTAHTLERTKGETALLVLRERKDDGSWQRRDHKIPIRQGTDPLWTKHPTEDVAVLRLVDPLPLPVTPLPASALASTERLAAEGLDTCSPIFVLTYPHRFEANDAAFPVARQGIVAGHPFPARGGKPRFLADFTAFAGDSGGPVFVKTRDGKPLVIGLVVAQFRHDEKVRTEVEERTIHHPLGLGSVLHAHIVREALDQAAHATVTETRAHP